MCVCGGGGGGGGGREEGGVLLNFSLIDILCLTVFRVSHKHENCCVLFS